MSISKEMYALELENITKVFPGVKALEDVTIKIKKGEVHALVGENGAGKSTLIKVICGVFKPEKGTIKVYGEKAELHTAQDAFDLGIGVVHQERNLIDSFSVGENICLSDRAKNMFGKVNKKDINEKAQKVLNMIQSDLNPEQSITDLTSGKKQMIEIARALSMNSKILILDEPTASISINEAEVLLQLIENLRDNGISIIYVSHKLEEIFRIADSITIIRDGKKVEDTFVKDDINQDKLIEKMVGRKEGMVSMPMRDLSKAKIVMNGENITSKLDTIPKSFQLKEGEILGWYGLVGAGRTEFARQIIGIDPIKSGTLKIRGKEVKIRNYEQAFKNHKIYYISENRKEEGLFLQHKVSTNITIVVMKKILSKLKLISYKTEYDLAEYYREKLQIKTRDVMTEVVSLSGGNQQKICIAKGLITESDILIIDEPTVGIDVKTKAEIHRIIYDLAQKGISIILISSDLPEMIGLVDRVVVFSEGQIKGEFENKKDYAKMSTMIMGNILL